MSAIRLASKVNREVNKAESQKSSVMLETKNVQGEDQQKLDVLANNLFIEALSSGSSLGIASEESDDLYKLKRQATLTLINMVLI